MQSVVVEFGTEAHRLIDALSNSLCDVTTKLEEYAHSAPHHRPIIMQVCPECNGTGYLSPNGVSVMVGEHCPGWRYCTCGSGKAVQ